MRSLSLDQLIDQITDCTIGMPVRFMEQVLAHGETAVPVLTAAIAQCHEDEKREILWLIVLLGEIRSAAGIKPLIDLLHPPQHDSYAPAAADGLAKIGPPAISQLIEAAKSEDLLQRLYAYAALGRIGDDRAYAFLLESLSRDPDLGEVLASTFCDQKRAEAIPHLYRAYQTCEPWQRVEFEGAIRELHWKETLERPWNRDWRLRYRIRAGWGSFEPDWVGVSAIVHKDREQFPPPDPPPLRSLEEIVAEPLESDFPSKICEDCGEPIEYPTGLPVCPESAVEIAIQQGGMVEAYHRQGVTDLFEVLDILEEEEWDHEERRKTAKKKDRQRWEDKKEELAIHHRTCEWLIEQGIEETGPVKDFLLNKAVELAERFGFPEGFLPPSRQPVPSGLKVGRNEPCPCGSGKKYKRCCGG